MFRDYDSVSRGFILACRPNILKLRLAGGIFQLKPDPTPHDIAEAHVNPTAPLLIVDVDEVLALFMRGFERFVAPYGYEMRITRFALFQNIYRLADGEVMDLDLGRELFNRFFEEEVAHIEATPGACAALGGLAGRASIVVLTNAPGHCREPRARWLARNGFPYPLVINSGPKGPAVAALAARTRAPVAFVDDLLSNLESVAADAPDVRRFQHVADARLRPFAPGDPERHHRVDDWPALAEAIRLSLGLPPE